MENRIDRFLDTYRKLEQYIRVTYDLNRNESPLGFLIRRPEFRSVRDELDYCREVRNLLSHAPKVNDQFGVEPSNELISLLEKTIMKVQDPPKAMSIAIPKAQIYSRKLSDCVLPAMREMNSKVYTHIPILEDDVVCGVFSENTLLSYLSNEEIVCIDSDTHFSDLSDYLPLEKHAAESFRFVSKTAFLTDISTLFEDALSQNDRIGMIFVTNSGKPNEKLLGIITVWDVAGAGSKI